MSQSGPPDTRAQPQQPAASVAGAGDAPEQAQSRAQARAQAGGQSRAQAGGQATAAVLPAGLTRPPAAGELAYESTITAPTEWVPYVYTTAEIRTHAPRRGLSVAAVLCGVLGLLAGIFVLWGFPLSFAAVVLACVARFVQHRSGTMWIVALVSGLAGLVMAGLWLVVILQLLPDYYG